MTQNPDPGKVFERGGNRITLNRDYLTLFHGRNFITKVTDLFRGRVVNPDDFAATIGPSSGKEFPIPRPEKWPGIMSWPPQDIRRNWSEIARHVRIAEREGPPAGLTPDQAKEEMKRREESRRVIRDMVTSFAERAKMMERLEKENERYVDDAPERMRLPVGAAGNGLGRFFTQVDRTETVSWALLLNPDAPSLQKEVSNWGRNGAETLDGGLVIADKSRVIMHKFSNQAAMLMAQECAARGWPEARVRVPFKHLDAVKSAFASAGIDAVIIPKKRIIFMPVAGNPHTVRQNPPINDFKDVLKKMRAWRDAKDSGPDEGGNGPRGPHDKGGNGPRWPHDKGNPPEAPPESTSVILRHRRPEREMKDVTPSGYTRQDQIFSHETKITKAGRADFASLLPPEIKALIGTEDGKRARKGSAPDRFGYVDSGKSPFSSANLSGKGATDPDVERVVTGGPDPDVVRVDDRSKPEGKPSRDDVIEI